MDAVQRVTDSFAESIRIKAEAGSRLAPAIASAAEALTACLLNGNKILCCGNGGSAADAQHFASEMINRYELERPGLPAIALTTDSSVLTSIANDYQYADVFARQVQALGQAGDTLLAISTSGASHSVIHAIDTAHDRRMSTIALTGKNGGQVAEILQETDIELRVPAASTARIQEVHLVILHSLCDLIDHKLIGAHT